MRSTLRLRNRTGRLWPVLFLFIFSSTGSAEDVGTDAVLPPAVRLEWNALLKKGQLQLRPVLQCTRPCELGFELVTLDNPAQQIRQGGQLQLTGEAPYQLGQLSFSTRVAPCRLRLTLRHDDGRQEHYEIDPCSVSSP